MSPWETHDSGFCLDVSSINNNKLLPKNIATFTCLLYFNCIYVCVIDRMYCNLLLLLKIKDSWLLTAVVVAAVLCWAIDMRSGFYLLMHRCLINIHMRICSCTFVVGVHVRMSIYLWLCMCKYAYSLVYVCISYICIYVHGCLCAYVCLHKF